MRYIFLFITLLFQIPLSAQTLTLVELNCENLFDCYDDSLKQDEEWLPTSVRRWTPKRYWRKQNHIAQEILSCQQEGIPDLVALVEVENDSVLSHLTRHSLLRHARYQYLMTESPDVRGIDVALLYQPFTFRPFCYETYRITPLENMRPTRDILYVEGEFISGDTLHIFVVHAPSRFGGEKATRPNRQLIADCLVEAIKQLPSGAKVIIVGDFNDRADDPALKYLEHHSLVNITRNATGGHGAKSTYRYQGEWGSIDHIFVSKVLLNFVEQTFVNDAPFLVEEDKKYGGVKPLRTYIGPRYQLGFSDHLPLVARFRF